MTRARTATHPVARRDDRRDDHRGARIDLHAQGGFVAGGETLLLGSLVFLVGILLAVNAWNVVDARMSTDGVAREVARTLVEADGGPALQARLDEVASATLAAMGRDGTPRLAYLDPSGREVSDPAALVQRCDRVTVRATITITTARLPFVGTWGTPWTITGQHHEIVDPYRSGLAGEATCGS